MNEEKKKKGKKGNYKFLSFSCDTYTYVCRISYAETKYASSNGSYCEKIKKKICKLKWCAIKWMTFNFGCVANIVNVTISFKFHTNNYIVHHTDCSLKNLIERSGCLCSRVCNNRSINDIVIKHLCHKMIEFLSSNKNNITKKSFFYVRACRRLLYPTSISIFRIYSIKLKYWLNVSIILCKQISLLPIARR